MKILLVHNHYMQPGGEDVEFQNELELLRRHGHDVLSHEEHNARIARSNPARIAAETVWSEPFRRRLLGMMDEFGPEVVHFQNTFPLISPSAYYACRQRKAAVVQTLQNYRLICPVATLYREDQPCEECLGKPIAWPGIRHACYRGSRLQTGVVAAMLAAHHALGTWRGVVDAYIVLSEFAREKFIAGGLPPDKLFLKPNVSLFSPVRKTGPGDFALYVGRLAAEKGIRTLLAAWKSIAFPLKIAGDGPLRASVLAAVRETNGSIEYLGTISHEEVSRLMAQARMLIFPSEWYEGFPLVLAEAFACGLSVLTADIGSQAEIIEEGRTGVHFRAGDKVDLRRKAAWCLDNPQELERMSRNARTVFEEKYAPETNYRQLMQIYLRALEGRR